MDGMRVVNTDATSYRSKTPKKCLETAEKEKKKNHIDACLRQRREFNPFIVSADVLLGVESEATLKRTTSRLVTKWKESYSHTCGYTKSRVAITLIRATHRCIRGGRVRASQISAKRPQWEDGTDLHLFR